VTEKGAAELHDCAVELAASFFHARLHLIPDSFLSMFVPRLTLGPDAAVYS
jgi:hypothetical protein